MKKTVLLSLIVILSATLLCFWPALQADFTNWDDPQFVTENPDIKDMSLSGLKKLMTSVYVKNWHPLTMLSYALEYHFFKRDPFYYHLTSLVVHALNTALVFWLIIALTQNLFSAFVCSLLFGIHPTHVESVAWIAERKDVLFAFFYLGGLIAYAQYVRHSEQKKYYILSIILCSLSLISKVTAVTFPLILITLDIYLGRGFKKKLIYEKIPFFILSFIAGCVVLWTHTDQFTLRVEITQAYNLLDRILFAAYGLVFYFFKLLVPIQLSAVYPYPEKSSGFLPLIYYLAPVILLGLAIVLIKRFKANKNIVFGCIFFVVTVSVNLQFSVIGDAVTADRFMYLSSVGVFLALASLIQEVAGYPFAREQGRLKPALIAVTAYIILSGAGTYQRCFVWKDSIALWTDVIDKNPDAGLAYYNRAEAYSSQGRLDLAVADYSMALDKSSIYMYKDIFVNRGQLLGRLGRYESALNDLNRALMIQPRSQHALSNRALVYMGMGKDDLAHEDFERILEIDPGNAAVYNNRGSLYFREGKYDAALSDYQSVIQISPRYALAWENIAKTFRQLERLDEAAVSYTKAIALEPTNPKHYYNRALVFLDKALFQLALEDLNRALHLNQKLTFIYYSRSKVLGAMGEIEKALEDATRARALGVSVEDEYLSMLRSRLKH